MNQTISYQCESCKNSFPDMQQYHYHKCQYGLQQSQQWGGQPAYIQPSYNYTNEDIHKQIEDLRTEIHIQHIEIVKLLNKLVQPEYKEES